MFGRKKKRYEDEEYYEDEYEDDEYDDEYDDDDEYEDEEEFDSAERDALLKEIKQLENEKDQLRRELASAKKNFNDQSEEMDRLLLKLSRVEEIKSQHSALQEAYGSLQEEYAKRKASFEDTQNTTASKDAELIAVRAELAAAKESQFQAESRAVTLDAQLQEALVQSKKYESHAAQLSEVGEVLLAAKNQARQIVLEANSEAEGIRLVAEEAARKTHEKSQAKIQVIRKESESLQQGLEVWRDDLVRNMNQLVEKSRYVLGSEVNEAREVREEGEQ